jgi:starvation-inducible DNA-binding protein
MSAPTPNTKTASDSSSDVAPKTREADVTTDLNNLLADATVFYQKVRHYHWNVTGPHFFTLHDKFEELYNFWSDAIDEIAEQVRSRGDRPVHTLADVLDLASLEEDPSTPAADEMVEVIIDDLAALDEQVQRLADRAENADDSGAVTVLEDLSEQIEEDRWMLRAWLNDL